MKSVENSLFYSNNKVTSIQKTVIDNKDHHIDAPVFICSIYDMGQNILKVIGICIQIFRSRML